MFISKVTRRSGQEFEVEKIHTPIIECRYGITGPPVVVL